MNCTRHLDHVVPVDLSEGVVVISHRPELVFVQTLPTIATAAVWLTFILTRHRRAVSGKVRGVARILALGVGCALSLIAWRIVELAECDSHVAGGGVWRAVASASTALGTFLIVIPLSQRAPFVAILVSLACAVATVVVDVGLRGWWVVTHAAVPLMYAQHLCDAVVALLLLTLPSRVAAHSSKVSLERSKIVAVVDALETRRQRDVAASCPPPSSSSSWFW